MDIRELTVCCLGSVLGALLFEEDGLMLAYEKLKSKLQREYTREASFLRLVISTRLSTPFNRREI